MGGTFVDGRTTRQDWGQTWFDKLQQVHHASRRVENSWRVPRRCDINASAGTLY